MKPYVFTFYAYGHPRVSATHPTTLEITRDDHLTAHGDCIVAVGSTCGLRELPSRIKGALSRNGGRAMLTIRVAGHSFKVQGIGSDALTFEDPREIVVRKSAFVSNRTLMVYANKAASDIPRSLVRLLQIPEERVVVEISVSG